MAPETATIASILARVPLFAGLPAEKLSLLAAKVQPRRCQSGERIVQAGAAGDSFYYILAGKVKVTHKIRRGEETVINLLSPGEFFGEQALLDGQPRSASIYAVDETVVLILTRDEFLRFLLAQPAAAIAIIVALSERIRRLNTQVEEAYYMELPERLARRILEFSQKHGVRTPGGIEVQTRLSVPELASSVGGKTEQVERLLRVWQEQGILRLSWDQEIVLVLPQALESVR